MTMDTVEMDAIYVKGMSVLWILTITDLYLVFFILGEKNPKVFSVWFIFDIYAILLSADISALYVRPHFLV